MISKLLVYYELLSNGPISRKTIEKYPGLETRGYVKRTSVKKEGYTIETFPETEKGKRILESVLMKTIIEELQLYKENLEK